MKLKLIYPPSYGVIVNSKRRLIPLPSGLCVLAAFLRKHQHLVDIQDIDAHFNCHSFSLRFRNIRREIANFYKRQIIAGKYTGLTNIKNTKLADKLLKYLDITGYDAVGIGIISSEQILNALVLAEKIKQEFGIPIIIGGPYVTLFARFFFEKYKFIDYAIEGSAEIPLLRLMECLEKKRSLIKVPSLWYRENKELRYNQRKYYNIEDQSCPDFDGLPLEQYKQYMNAKSVRSIPYMASSGCINKCAFCNYLSLEGPWQVKSVAKVVREIIFLKQRYKRKIIFFEDANFNASYKHTEELCDELIKQKINIKWQTRVYSNLIDEHLLVKMRQAGCVRLYWGIESASKETLKMMKKKIDIAHAARMISLASKLGIYNTVYLIVGYPYDTVDSLKKTELFIKRNAKFIYDVKILHLGVYPGTYLYENNDKARIIIKHTPRSFFTYAYGYEEMEPISKIQKKLNILARTKIMDYGNKYINYKHFQFPMNIIVRLFGNPFRNRYSSRLFLKKKIN